MVKENQKKENKASGISTAEELETLYPDLVSEIKDKVIGQIRKSKAEQIKENLPEIYQRVVEDIQGKKGVDKSVPGFLLDIGDPVAEGTLRTYQRLKGITGLRLPCVLPYKDKASIAALENYILRAEGGGDAKRAESARKALEKCKKN